MIRGLRNDDRGTSLLIVLMVITFVSVVTGVILSQEGTSVKTTEVLQDQSAIDYGADGAGQAVVTQLKNGQFACTATTGATLNLGSGPSNPFYRPVGAASGSQNAVATCTPDTTTGVTSTVTGTGTMVGAANTPSAAITTVGSSLADGIIAVAPFSLCAQGSVLSYTTITGILSVGANSSGSQTACPNTTSAAIKVQAFGNPLAIPIIPGCVGLFPITQCTPLGSSTPPIPTVPDPGYAITAANTNQAAVCQTSGSKTYAAFLPGLYTQVTSSSASSLNTPCKSGSKWVAANVDWFTPGVYYFNFGATTWTLPAALVGGTPATSSGQPITGLNPANSTTLGASVLSNLSQMPTGEGKCVAPTAQTQAGEGGVEFVFGGASTMTGMAPPTFLGVPTGPSTDMDICASYSASSPPVAIYGVSQNPLTEGSAQVPAESGCVATPGCVGTINSLFNWPVTVLGLPVDQTFHIDGYVWAPAAAMVITYANSNGQAFNWGVLVRTFQMLGVTSLTMARVPAANAGQVTTFTYSVRYVNVWTCAASLTPCSPAGPPHVQIKLLQTGSTWKVLSWSEQH